MSERALQESASLVDAFEPVVILYCCQWCSYAAADLAGAMRLSYPPNVRIVQVPCTGRVDILHLLKPLEHGADGVYVSGCLPGECHYVSGNLKAAKRVAQVQKILESVGVERDRVGIVYNSASMGPQFAQCCRDITERVRAMGPMFAGVERKLEA
ncbi:hydrogenase iron-sulfur subunit [Desulfosoma caldarium]|uniref:F420-non-reducing hydrogenase subunit D n=1 Tax=Desulfosoma caldarium TaxID=610254 RepID=A0A3N1UST5_9BACT|nr:hydrogenase iron-sulfur subunit [Desulfosoma caldarium]ROQ93203.1 F420-non-reducing hydrogenase subunit D [Desulfosoma caldarium]